MSLESLNSVVRVTGTQAGFLQGQASAVCLTKLLRPGLTGLEILELFDPLGQIRFHSGLFPGRDPLIEFIEGFLKVSPRKGEGISPDSCPATRWRRLPHFVSDILQGLQKWLTVGRIPQSLKGFQ